MDPLATPLLGLAERRLAYIDSRQDVLARNVANADTPGYVPEDLPPFLTTLAGAFAASGTMTRTSALHLAGATDDGAAPEERATRQPDGNAVDLDSQIIRLADGQGAHALVTNLWGKYMSLFRLALGRAQ